MERGRLDHALRLCIGVASAAALVTGWKAFYFLTDDAHIEFRYVANSLDGLGFVWNPPPFMPVEGYTSLSWVVLLKWCWQVFGVAPPTSAPVLALACGALTLTVVYSWLDRMPMPDRCAKLRSVFLALVCAGILTNRTFFTWLSSGLETAFFNLLFVYWVYEGTRRATERDARWAVRLCAAALLVELTRPDGLLVVAATSAIVFVEYAAIPLSERRRPFKTAWLALAVWALVFVHIGWRYVTYGDVLPNTYYAKHVAAWPTSGARYAASFVFEYGVWVWLVFALAWFGVTAFHILRLGASAVDRAREFRQHITPTMTTLTVCAHVGYYTFIIGGDHFEYRVYSYLVPLLFVSAVWLLTRIWQRPALPVLALTLFIAAALPLQWLHWLKTKDLQTREQTHVLIYPLASFFPAPLSAAVARWDEWQAWLIRHHVCMRHQEHKIFYEWQVARLPSRSEGSRIPWSERAVLVDGVVGLPAWVLPHVAIIDALGLNDRVVAHTEVPAIDSEQRLMAHDRHAPPGYAECFRPNIDFIDRHPVPRKRNPPLTDDEIRACEQRFSELVGLQYERRGKSSFGNR